MLIFSLGNKKYKVEQNWAGIPKVNDISALANHNGRIYILQRENPYMLVFSKDGDLIDEWYDESINDGHYFSISENGNVLVADRDHHRIVILNTSGKILKVIGNPENPGEFGNPFNHPTDVAMTENGDIFVSDGYGNFNVHHFNSSGTLINSWGSPGKGGGEFSTPHSILVDKQNRVLVADRENNRIQIFNKEGSYLGEIKNMFHPMAIFEDKEGLIYATDQTPSLYLFSPNGEIVGRCKTFGTYGHGLTVDENGDIYLGGMLPGSITKLVKICD